MDVQTVPPLRKKSSRPFIGSRIVPVLVFHRKLNKPLPVHCIPSNTPVSYEASLVPGTVLLSLSHRRPTLLLVFQVGHGHVEEAPLSERIGLWGAGV